MGSLSNLQSDRALANRLVQKLLIGENVTILDYFGSLQQREIRGVIIDETKSTWIVKSSDKLRRIPKIRTAIIIDDKNTKKAYRIEGKAFVGRVEERLKNVVRKMW